MLFKVVVSSCPSTDTGETRQVIRDSVFKGKIMLCSECQAAAGCQQFEPLTRRQSDNSDSISQSVFGNDSD